MWSLTWVTVGGFGKEVFKHTHSFSDFSCGVWIEVSYPNQREALFFLRIFFRNGPMPIRNRSCTMKTSVVVVAQEYKCLVSQFHACVPHIN